MIAKRADKSLYVECDGCGESTEDSPGRAFDWQDFMKDMREAGWRSRKDPDTNEWTHWCPDCKD